MPHALESLNCYVCSEGSPEWECKDCLEVLCDECAEQSSCPTNDAVQE